MPALANKLTKDNNKSVTPIDANARIDYILRFSKQVVLVIDESGDGYGDVTSQFLTTLPENHNAAYLALSPKLNDIQVRCRITEQLFTGTPFDPEQALATSIINLTANSKTPISIVVEHCHHLSLQILHELCQLADIAKKTEREINIVLTGEIAIGKLIASNSILFNQKISMVSAQTGQLISVRSDIFKEPKTFFSLAGYKKFILFFSILIIVSIGVIYSLYQRENLSFSGLNAIEQKVLKDNSSPVFVGSNSPLEMTTPNGEASPTVDLDSAKPLATSENNIANVSAKSADILSAITQKPKQIDVTLEPATAEDIVSALAAKESNTPPTEQKSLNRMSVSEPAEKTQLTNEVNEYSLNESYFTALDFGYLIQFITMTYQNESELPSLVKNFADNHENVSFKYYRRLMNGKKVITITSEFFTEKEFATTELKSLPSTLTTHGPWIKTVDQVKAEIAAFKAPNGE